MKLAGQTISLFLLFGSAFAAEPGMSFIPGGEFLRGRAYDWPDVKLMWYPNALKDDVPVRKIAVDPFYMDEAEVTNERYAAFVKTLRRKPPYQWRCREVSKVTEKRPV